MTLTCPEYKLITKLYGRTLNSRIEVGKLSLYEASQQLS